MNNRIMENTVHTMITVQMFFLKSFYFSANLLAIIRFLLKMIHHIST